MKDGILGERFHELMDKALVIADQIRRDSRPNVMSQTLNRARAVQLADLVEEMNAELCRDDEPAATPSGDAA